MRVRVSGMAWLSKKELGADGVVKVKKDLLIIPKKQSYGDDDSPPVPIQCWAETLDELGVPRSYFFASADKQHDIEWCLGEGHPMNVTSLLRQEGPYAEQIEAIASFADRYKAFNYTQATGQNLSGILRAVTGFGKTNTALALIQRVALTTVIVVHKEFLLTQWVKRIARFLPDAKVGICRGSKCDFEGKDIVLAMAQSLAREDPDAPSRYPEEFYQHFGLLVVDEVHRVGAPTWSPIPQMFPAKYRIGLTATPRRKDGADKVFWWHLGEIVYTAKTETPKPHVKMVNLATRGPSIMHQEQAPRGLVMKLLQQNQDRNTSIVMELVEAMKSPAQRKVLVLSHFLEHLKDLESLFRERMLKEGMPDVTTSFYVGEWFSDESTLSLAKRKAPLEGDRDRAIDALFRHFRRKFFENGDPADDNVDQTLVRMVVNAKDKPWRCAETFEGKRFVALYKHGFRPVCLEDTTDKGLIAMAKDYDVAQAKSVVKKQTLTEEQLFQAEKARVIFATFAMCSEGVDIAAVDTLGLVTPMSDVEQSYGRARRNCVPQRHGGEMSPEACEHLCSWRAETCTGKPHPITFDICDPMVPVVNRSKRHRLAFYKSIGAKVVESKVG
jgi:hypothetical protein